MSLAPYLQTELRHDLRVLNKLQQPVIPSEAEGRFSSGHGFTPCRQPQKGDRL